MSEVKQVKELTVCDIMGEWGAYQWSVTLFATLYSAIFGLTLVSGPLWTPDMKHVCIPGLKNDSSNFEQATISFAGNPHECYANPQSFLENLDRAEECTTFFYDDSEHGIVLTNTFDLVCSREWLKSAVSSSGLAGMLLSSVTLGLLSDKYGRMSCIRTGFVISITATILAILAHNYLLLNIFIMLMSFAQVGVANALCTLVMESTTPNYRFVPVFEYGFGWGLGMLASPFLNDFTKNYKHFLLVSLVIQLLMCIWLKYGVFESIRWLLSEGLINQAQIELRHACRFNRVKNGAELAQKIAEVQMNQIRKASCIIEQKMAPMKLAKAMQSEVETASQELTMLSSAIRKSFSINTPPQINNNTNNNNNDQPEAVNNDNSGRQMSLTVYDEKEQQKQLVDMMISGNCGPHRNSITTQGLIQLALKYSKTLQQQDEGKFFLVQMFHKKLYKLTIILMLASLMIETSYYGLVQANKFVGTNINVNYITGAIGEWVAAFCYILLMATFNRRVALIVPTVTGSLACIMIALSYQLIPNHNTAENIEHGLTGSGINFQSIAFFYNNNNNSTMLINSEQHYTQQEMIDYRENINFYIMSIGKLAITAAIQVSSTIVLEAYPNNLRQTGSGAIVMVGRMGSILAPFLFNDKSEDRFILRMTLLGLGFIGIIVSSAVPFLVRDTTGKELCDRMNEIDDD